LYLKIQDFCDITLLFGVRFLMFWRVTYSIFRDK